MRNLPKTFMTFARRIRSGKGRERKTRSHRQQRMRIASWAIVIGAIAAVIELPMPAEDAARAARAELRSVEAPGDIVVIAVDDASLNELQTDKPSRFDDARMVERAFAAGVERLVFDRAYADPASAEEDAAFARTLASYRGRVWLGAIPEANGELQKHAELVPAPSLRDSVAIASMMGQSAPFGLSVRFPTTAVIEGEDVPSISAVLAGYSGRDGWYRPDFAFDPATIPTYSYADVLLGRVSAAELDGKIAVVAPTHLSSPDFHDLPLGSKIAGVYFHVLGAYTLKGGLPLDLSWYPALMFAAIILLFQSRRRRPSRLATWAAVGCLALGPLALEEAGIAVEIFPALIALAIGTIRLRRLADRIHSKSTNLLLPDAIADAQRNEDVDVYALKINNIGDLSETAISRDMGRFVERLVDYLGTATEANAEDGAYAFEKDTLVWKAPRIAMRELEGAGLGLVTLLRAARGLGTRDEKIEATLGIDTNYRLSLEARSQMAIQAAELGARRNARVVVADGRYIAERERRLSLLAHLERGIADRRIGIGFQPKIDLSSRTVVGAEALIRWTHAELGYVDPQELVRTAEEHGRIDELTSYVLDEALRQGRKALAKDSDFRLAINVSAQSLVNETIAKDVAHLLDRHRFPGTNLILEVTESSPLDDQKVEQQITELKRLGVSFSIDDFGTGHSSLDYLQRVPSSEIKIDRRFVMQLTSSPDSEAVVRGTIQMAHKMGKTVAAEGVEDDLTAERLRRMGCDLAQGFLYSPAVPINEIIHMIEKERAAA